jgi:hypothetical protein
METRQLIGMAIGVLVKLWLRSQACVGVPGDRALGPAREDPAVQGGLELFVDDSREGRRLKATAR